MSNVKLKYLEDIKQLLYNKKPIQRKKSSKFGPAESCRQQYRNIHKGALK